MVGKEKKTEKERRRNIAQAIMTSLNLDMVLKFAEVKLSEINGKEIKVFNMSDNRDGSDYYETDQGIMGIYKKVCERWDIECEYESEDIECIEPEKASISFCDDYQQVLTLSSSEDAVDFIKLMKQQFQKAKSK